MNNKLTPGAAMVANAISRLPEDSKAIFLKAQGIATKRQRAWLREMERELISAKKEGREPMGTPCPPSLFEGEPRAWTRRRFLDG